MHGSGHAMSLGRFHEDTRLRFEEIMRYGKRQRTPTAPAPSSSSAAPTRSAESAEAAARSSRGVESAWWVRQPERYEYELAQLDAAGIDYSMDEVARDEGILRLDLSIPGEEGESLKLQVTFPDLYPYFRFEVRAPEIDLPHHQNPFSKNLCLLGRSTRHWNTSDTLAKFIRERVPLVLTAGKVLGYRRCRSTGRTPRRAIQRLLSVSGWFDDYGRLILADFRTLYGRNALGGGESLTAERFKIPGHSA